MNKNLNLYQLTIGSPVLATAADLKAFLILSCLAKDFSLTKPVLRVTEAPIEEMVLENGNTGEEITFNVTEYVLSNGNDSNTNEMIHDVESYLVAQGSLPYSLKTVQTPNLAVLAQSSAVTKTIERIDTGEVMKGDVAACYSLQENSDSLKKWFDEFTFIPNAGQILVDGVGKKPVDLIYGVANSTKSEIVDPFNESLLTVAANRFQIEKLQNESL